LLKRGNSSLWDHFPVVRQAKGGEEGFYKTMSLLLLQRQIIKNPTPTLTLPLKGRGFYGVFSLSWKVFQSLSFQGGGQEGDGVYMSL
jgi:hypothetical protein